MSLLILSSDCQMNFIVNLQHRSSSSMFFCRQRPGRTAFTMLSESDNIYCPLRIYFVMLIFDVYTNIYLISTIHRTLNELNMVYHFIIDIANYNASEVIAELYPFQHCYPGFFGLNCQKRCHCDLSCKCDPIVGCTQCGGNAGCDLLHREFPTCQGMSCKAKK